ncbi:GIY-YIG nuclease family protein [Candidatus Kaiserbacteria bacterium]|nr:GIY-YIG nuclease family protein [Candidatus Kaiserbacteria bacterium]
MLIAKLNKQKIPDAPGVYFFLGSKKEILYIGRATSLRNRVTSYFDASIRDKRSPLIEKMVVEAMSIEWTKTDSVLEAMILETNLIRTHKPRFNTVAKDDKSYNHLVITKEDFPRVLTVRAKDLTEKFTKGELMHAFGPFPSGGLLKEALTIVRKLFRFYDTPQPVGAMRTKFARGSIDFNRQIGLYPNTTSQKEYARTIRHIRLLFEGKKGTIITELEKEMHTCAKKQLFEKAHVLKRRIQALAHIQDIALVKRDVRRYRDGKHMRIEAYDVAHHGGTDMVGVMTVVEAGKIAKDEYRRFKITSVTKSNDTAALGEILERRLAHHEWPLPQLIVVDGGVAQKRAAERVLTRVSLTVPVVGVVKDERHRPKKIIGVHKIMTDFHDLILLANAEAHRFAITYHRNKRSVR